MAKAHISLDEDYRHFITRAADDRDILSWRPLFEVPDEVLAEYEAAQTMERSLRKHIIDTYYNEEDD